MVEHVTAIIGPRSSGRSEELKRIWFEELEKSTNETFVTISTDIRAKESFNFVWNLNNNVKVYIVNPIGDTVKFYHRHKIKTFSFWDGMQMLLKERDIFLYIDNISLNRTEDILRDEATHWDVKKVYFTGLRHFRGINKAILKECFNIEDLGKISYELIEKYRDESDS